MPGQPLRLPPLVPPGLTVLRSGLRWLCEDGQVCAPGTIIACCNIGVSPLERSSRCVPEFAPENRDFQAALVLRVGGRVRIASGISLGGFVDRAIFHCPWEAGATIGTLEPLDDSDPIRTDEPLRLMLAAGRRVTELAEVKTGLLAGWHDRSRVWWADAGSMFGTLLSLGGCDMTWTLRGEHSNYREFLCELPGASHVVVVPDDLMVHNARVLLEQLSRTPEQRDLITADLAATFPFGAPSVKPTDWFFVSGLLSALTRSPIDEAKPVLNASGIQTITCPDAMIVSLISEHGWVLRHRRLGYTICLLDFRITETSEAVRDWIRTHFEPVWRDPDAIRRDYRELFDAVRNAGIRHFLVMNRMSTTGHEDILTYAPFDLPLGKTIASVRSQEMNLMLHDLAAERDIAIIDNDAIAAELGGARHIPDGIHGSGTLQAELRREIRRILALRGVPGFAG